MIRILKALFIAVLFFLLTPGVLVRLPPKGSIYLVAAVHALIFAAIYHFTRGARHAVYRSLQPIKKSEGLDQKKPVSAPGPAGPVPAMPVVTAQKY
jgi:hypothetical protein